MGYFQELKLKCDELNEKGQQYLDSLPFIPNDKVVERIEEIAYQEFKSADGDWYKVPDLIADILDGYIPYTTIPKDGSLKFALGFAIVSNDAHLRNLLEIMEGRTTKELDFPVIVPNF